MRLIGGYGDFLAAKVPSFDSHGVKLADVAFARYRFFPHQLDLVQWALRRGRAAIFAGTGLGKTRMQIAWADAVVAASGRPALILAPLAVAEQTVREGRDVGVKVTHCREASQITDGINICNYERLHKLDPGIFGAVVLDESSIIKHHDAKTFDLLTEAFAETTYKLCATATPAPNDWTELGTHAEFLGVRSRTEMLAEFFVHDGGDTQSWRLKGHARGLFWRWVASWGALLRSPADLGHDASAYDLPPLNLTEHILRVERAMDGELFTRQAASLLDRRRARTASLPERVAECASIVNGTPGPWVVWCDLNAEGEALRDAIPGAVEIRGADDVDVKEKHLYDFANGAIRVLITKPSIAGFGLNWQHCAQMAFVGVTDSFEAYYQAVRRCWRFGQTKSVNVHIFASEAEGAVVANLKRKEREAESMGAALSAETAGAVRDNVLGFAREHNDYNPRNRVAVPSFLQGVA